MENHNNAVFVAPVRICGKVVLPSAIEEPALRRMIDDLANGDHATLVSCRHKDWSQQGQCGCVTGCLGG